MTKELAKTLTLALVNYLDDNRPEGTMDCSSGECVSLEKAFTEENFDSVETLIKKKLSRLTEFEEELAEAYEWANGTSREDFVKEFAPKLLALAKKELGEVYDAWIYDDPEYGRSVTGDVSSSYLPGSKVEIIILNNE